MGAVSCLRQPHSALHPTIGVHSPLIIDLFDHWNGRALEAVPIMVPPGWSKHDQFPGQCTGSRIPAFQSIRGYRTPAKGP